jgi:hypothetical protein
MIIDTSYKNTLANNLAHRLASAIQNGEIAKTEIEYACRFIVKGLEDMFNDEDRATFIDKITTSWPFFEDVLGTSSPSFESP